MLWNMHSSAWDIAKTSPATAHMPLDEQLTYADLFAAIDNWREYLAEERSERRRPCRRCSQAPISADSRRQIALHVAKARIFVRRRPRITPISSSVSTRSTSARTLSQLTIARDPQALCAPLPA